MREKGGSDRQIRENDCQHARLQRAVAADAAFAIQYEYTFTIEVKVTISGCPKINIESSQT